MPSCTISFNFKTENGVFYSGQEVSGSITMFNEKPRNLKTIIMNVEGYAMTSWTESSGSGKNRSSTTYSAREDYIMTTTRLFGLGSGERKNDNPFVDQELGAGYHTFNFCFLLPPTVPSSFSNFYGKVLYQIKVEMMRQLKFNYSFEFPFNVLTFVDLNYEGVELRNPLIGGSEKKFFLGLGSNALKFTAEIPFCGFVAGQILTISVDVMNDSSVRIEQVFVELRRLCHFKTKTTSNTKNHSQTLLRGQNNGVEKKSKSSQVFSIQIPPVEPTSVRFCKYIFITYEIAITAKVGAFHMSPTLRMPLTIGTVPLIGLECPQSTSPSVFTSSFSKDFASYASYDKDNNKNEKS